MGKVPLPPCLRCLARQGEHTGEHDECFHHDECFTTTSVFHRCQSSILDFPVTTGDNSAMLGTR
jgi:hypothetical protein